MVHVLCRLESERTKASIYDRIARLQQAIDVSDLILDRMAVPQPKSKCAAVREELWVLELAPLRIFGIPFLRWQRGEGARDRAFLGRYDRGCMSK